MNQKSIHGWFDELCLALPGASKSNKPERDATCYTVGGIAFALCETAKNGKPIISLKFDPAFGDLLRQQYNLDSRNYCNETGGEISKSINICRCFSNISPTRSFFPGRSKHSMTSSLSSSACKV